MKTTLVPPEHAFDVWPEVRGYLEQAVDIANGRWTMEHLLAVICNGRSQLWIAYDEDRIWGAVTTEITNYPGKKFLSMHFLGGLNFDLWYPKKKKNITNYAKQSGCQGIEGVARFGFWKFLKEDGFTKSSAFYEKGIEDE